MIIEELGRHLLIEDRVRAEEHVHADRDFWNVISLIGPRDLAFPENYGAKSIHTERFEDVEDPCEFGSVRSVHLKRIFAYVDALDFTEPILIHCTLGLSRSPAVMLGVIARSLYLDGEDAPVPKALDILIQLRPIAGPNMLVARLAFEQFLPSVEVEIALEMVRSDNVLKGNRFHRS